DRVINGIKFVEKGMKASLSTRQTLQETMKSKELQVVIDLHLGEATFNVWTCDLSFDYVKINSHYS
ncbi:MAG: bifunctional ornithine acetyltransferase/N-acetylglutamate synthase, partial [Atribacterota bacterium]|nr:bifunctional ornithine acetyltransferase/N-acetylglutamate synthase [Atribacterota bacterium]